MKEREDQHRHDEQQWNRLRCAPGDEPHAELRGERNRHPTALAERQLHGVDQLLHVSGVVEVALILLSFSENLVQEVADQIRVERRPPRLVLRSARRIERLWYFQFSKLHFILRRRLERL